MTAGLDIPLRRAGELFEITSGPRRAVVTEQGASLFRVQWDGRDLLDYTHDDGYGADGCHGQILMPWPGRVPQGLYEHQGQRLQLPITDHVTGAAIHGWTRWATWQPAERTDDSITLRCRLLALPGYPFPFEYEQTYSWHGDRLEIATVAHNIGSGPAPWGYGAHPYFSLGTPTIDPGILQVPAGQYFQPGANLVPKGAPLPVDGTEFDFRAGRPIGSSVLDTTLCGLARDEHGWAEISYGAPDDSLRICLRFGPHLDYVQLFTGDTLPSHRRQGLAIEPNTCPPNAFNTGTGLMIIPAGGSARVAWSLSAR
jgi:aldose 1-epimerase